MLPLALVLHLAVAVAAGIHPPVNEPEPGIASSAAAPWFSFGAPTTRSTSTPTPTPTTTPTTTTTPTATPTATLTATATPTATPSTSPPQLALAPAAPAIPPHLLAPQLDPGPFGGNEIAAAAVGSLLGDALVLAGGYGALQMFASGALQPTATNFRHAAYALGVSALVVPPLTAVLLARWARADPASGSAWKALLLATAGQALALGAGYLAAPQLWVIVPVQLVTIAVGTTLGFHWGPHPRAAQPEERGTEARRGPADAPARADPSAVLSVPICPAA